MKILLLLPILIISLSGCFGDKDSDPFKDHQHLKNFEKKAPGETPPPPPVKVVEVVKQELVYPEYNAQHLRGLVFRIDSEQFGDPSLDFIAGQESQYEIKPTVLVDGAVYQLTSDNLPSGASLKFVDKKWILKWSPDANFTEGRPEKRIPIKVYAKIDESTTPPKALKVLQSEVLDRQITLIVKQNPNKPTIKLPQWKEDTVINLGEALLVTVQVNDPALPANEKAIVYPYFDETLGTETQSVLNGAALLTAHPTKTPSKANDKGLWNYYYLLNTQLLKSPEYSKILKSQPDKLIKVGIGFAAIGYWGRGQAGVLSTTVQIKIPKGE